MKSRRMVGLLGVLVMLFVLPGCSMLHWGGEMAAQSPGLRIEKGWGGMAATYTANGKASIKKIEYTEKYDPNAKQTLKSLTADDVLFDQDPATTLKEYPAVLQQVTAIALTNVQAIQAVGKTISDTTESVASVFSPFAAVAKMVNSWSKNTHDNTLTLTIPGGTTIGSHTVSTPEEAAAAFADLQSQIDQLKAANAALQAATASPPAGATP